MPPPKSKAAPIAPAITPVKAPPVSPGVEVAETPVPAEMQSVLAGSPGSEPLASSNLENKRYITNNRQRNSPIGCACYLSVEHTENRNILT